jgi:hypothetical protein
MNRDEENRETGERPGCQEGDQTGEGTMAGVPPYQGKVLRIGVIADGKIVQERVIKGGEPVTIGPAPKNTFVLKTGLPRQDFPLFVAKGNRYWLQLTESMRGKVGSGGDVVSLDKIRTDPSIEKDGAVWRVPLDEQDRGKIAVGDVTILFQFVSAPASAGASSGRVDFRPRLVEHDDALLFGFLALFGAMGAMFVVWVWSNEPVKIESPDDLGDWTKFAVAARADVPDPAPVPVEMPTGETPETPSHTPPPPDQGGDPTQRQADARDRVSNDALVRFLTQRGSDGDGRVAPGGLFTDDLGLIAEATDRIVTDGPVADATAGPRSTGGTPGAEADIEPIDRIAVRKAAVTATPEVEVDAGEGEADEEMEPADVTAVKKTVQRYSGQLKYCYEARLNKNPDLSGRVEIGWTMADGRVTSVEVFANSTGDQELASCIEQKIERWPFPPQVEGEVSWPFIFQKAK